MRNKLKTEVAVSFRRKLWFWNVNIREMCSCQAAYIVNKCELNMTKRWREANSKDMHS
jgi:hypothetical protein